MSVSAQDFDMLIRGGHVLDARNDVDGVMDLAIDDGVIAEVAASIDPSRAETVVDATGLYVTPGLVDLHVRHELDLLLRKEVPPHLLRERRKPRAATGRQHRPGQAARDL